MKRRARRRLGTRGLGYQAATLGQLEGEVRTVERRPELAGTAASNLAAEGVGNVHVRDGHGSAGLAEHAPYDVIVVAVAHPRVPAPLTAQLAPAGRLVQPIGPGGSEQVTLFRRSGDRVARVRLCWIS